VIVVVVFLGFFIFLYYLHYRNSHPKPIPEHKIPKWIKYTKIFIGSFALELFGMASTAYEIYSFKTNNWEGLDVAPIQIAFYIFQAIKYVMLFFFIFLEHFDEELDDKITYKFARIGVRSDWKGIIEGLIFVPCVIIDGMLLNAEFYIADLGNFFSGDGVIMITIDVILWIKLCTQLLLNQYSAKGRPPYLVKLFAYALIIFFYSVLLVFLFLLEHLQNLQRTKSMQLTPLMINTLICALTHSYVCSYTSMMFPGIMVLDRALRGSKARVRQLKVFIRFLQLHPIAILFTIGFHAYTWYIYLIIIYVSLQDVITVTADSSDFDYLQGATFAVMILVDIWTIFFFINLGFAGLRRLGGYLDIHFRIWRFSFPDCSAYATEINSILGQCAANFRINNRGQITR